ncbi:MAG: type IV pilus modification protein PilV [Pseudomonadota bacterium]|nr:type IV pilus modification protein PilV [Pseudomonadota bacterium]
MPLSSLPPPSTRATQRGGTLIEVLVAVFLLAVGLLAMAGLTASATGYNKISQVRGIGTMLVSDLADRARANLLGFDNGGYTVTRIAFGEAPPQECSSPFKGNVKPEGAEAMNAAACVAQIDLNEWLTEVQARLPGGDAVVDTINANWDTETNRGVRAMDIFIAWQEQDSLDGLNLSPTRCPIVTPGYRCMYFRVAL